MENVNVPKAMKDPGTELVFMNVCSWNIEILEEIASVIQAM